VLKSRSYVKTDGQSASLSWCQAPIWGLRSDFHCYQTVAGLLMWGALSDQRMSLPFTISVVLASTIILGSKSHGTRGHILLSQIRDSPNLEGQVPVFISPRSSVAQLYPQALGSLFVTSYDSHNFGGGIRTCLQVRKSWCRAPSGSHDQIFITL
jgi:hypothetical protein